MLFKRDNIEYNIQGQKKRGVSIMGLKAGIVGLPNVGKSTLFNAITNSHVEAANYPFATINPNTGVVNVPDERLEFLVNIFKPARTIPATVEFYDIAGLVRGASRGEGLGNQFLSHIRKATRFLSVPSRLPPLYHMRRLAHREKRHIFRRAEADKAAPYAPPDGRM